MTTTKQTTMTKKLNCIAHNVKKPTKPRKSEIWQNGEITNYLNANRAGLVKLRKRGFTWSQIAQVFERVGIPINHNNLYQWQLRHIPQRNKAKFKVGDTVQPKDNTILSRKNTYTVVERYPEQKMVLVKRGSMSYAIPEKKSLFTKVK